MARPGKLTPALIEVARSYVNGGWIELRHQVPLKEGLALQLDVSTETVRVWALEPEQTKSETKANYLKRKALHAEFSAIVSRLNATKTLETLNGGLKGKFPPKIVGMIVSRDGYSERVEQDITTGGDKLTTALVEFVSAKDKDSAS